MTTHHWQKCLATDAQGRDAVDRMIDDDDDLAADPIHDRPPARRNGGDADRLTALLDSLTVATDERKFRQK